MFQHHAVVHSHLHHLKSHRCYPMHWGQIARGYAIFLKPRNQETPLHETNSSSLKMMASNRNLLFQGSIFKGYMLVSGRAYTSAPWRWYLIFVEHHHASTTSTIISIIFITQTSSHLQEPRSFTLHTTNSLHLKIGHPTRKRSYSNHPVSGANC